jgi:CRP-like cAMP-binding protein
MDAPGLDLENSMEDFRITVERTGEAARWDEATINNWMEKGRAVCGDVMKEVAEALRRAEARKGEEVRGAADGDQPERVD